MRGHASDYDDWAAAGCEGWGYEDVLPYFKKSENNVRGEDEFHGASGPLHVRDSGSLHPLNEAFAASAEACQWRSNDDFNGAQQEGVGPYQVTQFHDHRNGERCSAAAGYLHPVMERSNLHVITGALARRVLFVGLRAEGVVFAKNNQEETVRAKIEVILSCGALQTPQLLLVSGVGPADHLQSHGVEVVHDSVNVGANLQEHPDFREYPKLCV